MGKETAIEWCDHTFNPWWGCLEVSPACANCYARDFAKRLGMDLWGPHAEYRTFGDKHWNEPLKWNAAAATAGVRRKVFCASMADVFDKKAPPGARARLWKLIRETPWLDWQLVTKRIENVPDMLPEDWGSAPGGGYPNVWLIATVANQDEADRIVPKLLAIPAAVHGLSIEPMLGPIDLSPWLDRLDWVICGGESGPKARPAHPDWVRALRDQCVAAGVAYFFKQWGEFGTAAFIVTTGLPVFRQFSSFDQWVAKASTWVAGGICLDRHGAELKRGADFETAAANDAFPVTIMHRLGKAKAGRLLDGRTWDEFPKVAA